MNSNYPSIKWRPNRGKTKEKRNELSPYELDQIDRREELLELMEQDHDFIYRNQPIKKHNG
jgi:hypothetical protein